MVLSNNVYLSEVLVNTHVLAAGVSRLGELLIRRMLAGTTIYTKYTPTHRVNGSPCVGIGLLGFRLDWDASVGLTKFTDRTLVAWTVPSGISWRCLTGDSTSAGGATAPERWQFGICGEKNCHTFLRCCSLARPFKTTVSKLFCSSRIKVGQYQYER